MMKSPLFQRLIIIISENTRLICQECSIALTGALDHLQLYLDVPKGVSYKAIVVNHKYIQRNYVACICFYTKLR